MKFIGLRGQKKAKQGNPWDWIKSKMKRHTSFSLAGTG